MSQFHELAVTLVGDTCVGKTMMIKTYVNGKCHQHKIAQGVVFPNENDIYQNIFLE